MREIKQLTRVEFQVMSILWNLPGESGYTGDILAKFEAPKPAYTTIATFLKILSNKGFVKSRKKENGKLYYVPTVSREEYAAIYLEPVKDTFFNGSFQEMIRFIFQHESLSEGEKQDIISILHETQEK